MRDAGSLFLCNEPRSTAWRVPQPEGGRLLLIGWADASQPVDAGVPPWAIDVLAGALTREHRTTFPSTIVRADETDSAAQLSAGGLWRRLTSKGPQRFSLITTQNPKILSYAFDDAGFPWWMQAQFILLSPLGASDPRISGTDVVDLINEPKTAARFLRRHGFVGYLSPGVDGDVAALLSLTESEGGLLISALEGAAKEAGIPLHTLSESAFMSQIAGPHTADR